MEPTTGEDPRQAGWLYVLLGVFVAACGYLLGQSISYGTLHGVRHTLGMMVIAVGGLVGAIDLIRGARRLTRP